MTKRNPSTFVMAVLVTAIQSKVQHASHPKHPEPHLRDRRVEARRNFGLSEGFFLDLQIDYELLARRHQIGEQLKAIRPRAA